MPWPSNLVVGGVRFANAWRLARSAPALKMTVRRSASRRVIGAEIVSDSGEDMGGVTGEGGGRESTCTPIIADARGCWHRRVLSAGRGQIGVDNLGAVQSLRRRYHFALIGNDLTEAVAAPLLFFVDAPIGAD